MSAMPPYLWYSHFHGVYNIHDACFVHDASDDHDVRDDMADTVSDSNLLYRFLLISKFLFIVFSLSSEQFVYMHLFRLLSGLHNLKIMKL